MSHHVHSPQTTSKMKYCTIILTVLGPLKPSELKLLLNMYKAWRVLGGPTESIYIWRVLKNIFNNQLQTAERGWLLAIHHKLEALKKMLYTASEWKNTIACTKLIHINS